MAGNVIRRDVVQIAWEVEESPFSKLNKQAQSFQSTVKRAVGGAESDLGKVSKGTDKSTSSFKKLASSVDDSAKFVRRLKGDIAQADAAIAKLRETAASVKAKFDQLKAKVEQLKAAASAVKEQFRAMVSALKPSNVIAKIRSQLEAMKAAAVQNVQHFKELGRQKLTNLVSSIRETKNTLTGGKSGAEGFKNALKNVAKISFSETVNGIKRIGSSIKSAKTNIKSFASNIKTGLQSGFQGAIAKGKQLFSTIRQVNKESLSKITSAVEKLGSKLGKGVVSAAKKAVSALAKVGAAATAGFAALTGGSVNAYADYEQLVGGVETLFKDAKGTVMKYANNAYKTAGMSANDYMETVTGFSASLLQSLGGDTQKAAEVSDRALTDMSDNANKMGTDIESIKNAYQGFAKGYYTMLDNLKLGYGGTQSEMQRLIKDAAGYKDIQEELGVTVDESSMSFGNIINAISVVQKKLGITGTTAKEASTTIQGSINSMKGAWTNFLAGMADPNQDMGQLVDNLVDSIVGVKDESGKLVGGVINNLFPRIQAAVPRLAQGLGTILSQLFTLAAQNINVLGPLAPIGQAIINIISGIKAKIQSITADQEKMAAIRNIFDSIKTAVSNAATFVGKLVGSIIDLCTQAPVLGTIQAIVDAISNAFKWLGDHMEAVTNILATIIPFIVSLAAIIKVVNVVMKVWSVIQLVVNAGLLACPITWIVLAIAALIAIIVVLVKNWDKVKAAAVGCWNKIKGVWGSVKDWFSSKVIQPVKNFFADLWEKVPAPIKDVISKITDGFQWAYDKVTGAWEGIQDFFSDLWKGVIKVVAKPVNKLIDGANWVMDKLGSDKKFGHWEPYARGTDGHPGGNAIVNDGRGAELVQMPNGATFIPKGRNVGIPNAPKGMKVLDAQRTAQVMGRSTPTFNYEEGTGWSIWDFFDNAKGLVDKVIDKFIGWNGVTGFALDAGKALINKAKDSMLDWVKGLFKKHGGKGICDYNPSEGVEQWRSTVSQALKMENLFSADNVKRTLHQMQTESGGNPRAINNWDSNAKKGTPSKGLMQVIDPTFKSYARKGFASDIYDPLSNILASVRYARARYGTLAEAYKGVGYAGGVGIPKIKLPAYSPESSVVNAGSSSTSNNYSPSFTLNMSGTVDRTTERTIKRWVQEALDEVFDSLSRTNPRIQEV